jgi:hypothetical protein
MPRVLAVIALLIPLSACNPFAPALEEGDDFDDLMGDPRTIEGFFTAFKYAYELRDINLYQSLLDSSFVFLYYDFDAGVERELRYAQDIESTRRMFNRATNIQLTWNQIIARDVFDDGRQAQVVRSFGLLIGLAGSEAIRGSGNVNFLLARRDTTAVWRLVRWRDESEF